MTLAAPRSRQGRLLLVLAFLAATVAIVGAFVWASNAQAAVPANTTVVLTNTPVGGTVAPGQTVTYTTTITTTAGAASNAPVFEIQADQNLWPTTIAATGMWTGANCVVMGGALFNDVKCTSGASLWVTPSTVTITYQVVQTDNNPISGPLLPDNPTDTCYVSDAGANGGGTTQNCTYTAANLQHAINDYTITPKTAEDMPGDNHKITINVPANFTCASDVTPADNIRQCNASDVILTPIAGAALVGNAVNVTGATGSAGTVDFTLNRATVGAVSARLNLIYDTTLGPNPGPQSFDVTVDPVAFKQWVVASQNIANLVDCGVITGTATSGGNTTLTDTAAAFPTGAVNLAGFQIIITGGTGNIDPNTLMPQVRTITQNTATTVTVAPAWSVNPANLSTYTISGGPCLRHVDLPDLGTEDAADPTLAQEQRAYCLAYLAANPTTPGPNADSIFAGVCGVLKGQDDVDDARGSFHGACILDTLLTHAANEGDITWIIDPIVISGTTVSPVSITRFAGPNGEPCVRWGSFGPGTQNISAVYHQGQADARTFLWDNLNKKALVKEWNTIDSTRIVSVPSPSGDLGVNPLDKIKGNTGGARDWLNRDCSLIPLAPAVGTGVPVAGGDCVLANLDSLTMPVEATTILNPNTGGFITAPGRVFIDYTMGQHADAGGSYSGPVDGAQQTYTIRGDCGSIRLENPTTGAIQIIAVKNTIVPFPKTRTILSSDKGVAFEFVPNADGAIVTTIGTHPDCGPGATICVDIDTQEANQFHSPDLIKLTRETICVQYHISPPTNKTPLLAWAGQRVVLENYWGDPTTTVACPLLAGTATGGTNIILLDTNTDFSAYPCQIVGKIIQFTGGPGAGQSAIIVQLVLNQLVFLDSTTLLPLTTPIGAGTVYSIAAIPAANHPCPVDQAAVGTSRGGPNDPQFGVQYSIQAGTGSFTGVPLFSTNNIFQSDHNAVVQVSVLPKPVAPVAGDVTDPNSNCTSRIIVESEDQTEMDVSAWVVQDGATLANARPYSQQVAFVIYFMKFESEKLQLIPDNIPTTDAWDKGGTPTNGPVTATVSDNVAAQVTVRGWVLTDNCPGNPERTVPVDGGNTGDGQARENFPANRCIFPDDWAFKAGAFSQTDLCTKHAPPSPTECFPQMDIATDATPYATLCPGSLIAGPFSLLDQITHNGLPVRCSTDSLAPYPPATLPPASVNCLTAGLSYRCRDNNFPDGKITTVDAPMPPAQVQFNLTGAGFLVCSLAQGTGNSCTKGITKAAAGVDTGFNSAAIPAEPWISQLNADGEGYIWNTWGAGANNGLYQYWTSLADHGPEVISCAAKSTGMFVNPANPGANPCVNDPTPLGLCQAPGAGVGCVRTGGFQMTEVYSDEHGIAMTLINGDANLDFTDCKTSAPVPGTHTVVLLHGFYCAKDATVGTSTLLAVVTYPDKRKHFSEVTNPVTITWKWNGTKDVSVIADPADVTGQFWYVVFHVTDRDGFCGSSDSLHPVLGEEVDFQLESATAHIVADVNGHWAEGPVFSALGFDGGQSATTHTFDSALAANATIKMPTMVTGECQAWIHVSESAHHLVDVVVTAFDPEGTVTFDNQDINPTPTAAPPTPVVTAAPTASPVTLHLKWGNTDCSQDGVTSRDAQAILKRVLEKTLLSVDQPCPSIGQTVIIGGNTQHWGNWDCSADGVTSRDAQADLKFVLLKTPLSQTPPCPAVGSDVDVQLVP